MLVDGWILGKLNKKRPNLTFEAGAGRMIRSAEEGRKAVEQAGVSFKFADV